MDYYLPLPLNTREIIFDKPASTKLWRYFRRILKIDQMDFEFAFWQMMYLFVTPQKVYRGFKYRKNYKFQFARDDPAFLLLLLTWFTLTSIGFALIFHSNIVNIISFTFYTIIVDCIGSGFAVATTFWFVMNKCSCLKRDRNIEWGYAFDVHLNALFPAMTIIHLCLLLLFNGLINHNWSLMRYAGNTFWWIAVSYYVYITFLGYNSLRILQRAYLLLLIPLLIFLPLYVISLIAEFNIMYSLMKCYEKRVM